MIAAKWKSHNLIEPSLLTHLPESSFTMFEILNKTQNTISSGLKSIDIKKKIKSTLNKVWNYYCKHTKNV